MPALALSLLATVALAQADADAGASPEPGWLDGEHLSGEWGGARTALAEHGLTLDLIYTAEVFLDTRGLAAGATGVTLLGHVDAALTVETAKLGLWPGGRLYVLDQNSHGQGINTLVGSATAISNLEAPQYTQLTELFFEQSFLDERLKFRIGKQDANREFGTPRYGGNFINNNFGMFPTSPLPSYPTTGLGAVVVGQPLDWLAVKAVLFEGSPRVGSLGLDSALASGAGLTVAGGLAVNHHYGAAGRNGGITSVAVWRQSVELPELGAAGTPRTFDGAVGVLVQNDEHLYRDASDPSNPSGLTLITRFAWSQPDRTAIPLYLGASLAWHGLGAWRDNDTVGVGFGYFTVTEPLGGTPGPGSELFVEAFYKLRLTHFVSLQPDLQYYRHPGGDGRDTLLAGLRLKLKL